MKKLTKDTLNFLPVEHAQGITFSKDFYYVAGLASLFAMYFVIAIGQMMITKNLEKELIKVTQESGLKSNEIDKINKELTAFEKRVASKNVLKAIGDKRFLWGEHFKEISLLVPNGVWISEMELKAVNQKIDIVIEGESLSYRNIAQFYQRLSQSMNYSNLLINSSNVDSNSNSYLTHFVFGTKKAEGKN